MRANDLTHLRDWHSLTSFNTCVSTLRSRTAEATHSSTSTGNLSFALFLLKESHNNCGRDLQPYFLDHQLSDQGSLVEQLHPCLWASRIAQKIGDAAKIVLTDATTAGFCYRAPVSGTQLLSTSKVIQCSGDKCALKRHHRTLRVCIGNRERRPWVTPDHEKDVAHLQ
jgi:hypothetical protein